MIEQSTRTRLLALARAALEACVRREPPPEVPPDLDVPASGVFVTIHTNGELRGCLGCLDERDPLGQSVARLAAAVTREDPRFAPLTLRELADTLIDLSVLTAPESVSDPTTIEVGRHGLIVEQGRRRGLLLPQVATEHVWDRETFLAHTCLKAGLSADAWRRGAVISRFEAEVFGEIAEVGAVRERPMRRR